MTTNSFTGVVNTEGQYETLASVTGLTLESGKSYTVQVQGGAKLKIANAEFPLYDERLTIGQSDDTIYIKTDDPTELIVLENA